MNRTKTNEEKEWREASHPRLVKRLEDQRTALADLNRQVQSLTAEIATLTAKRDQLRARLAFIESGENKDADGTDSAHPAYWRGSDDATKTLAQLVVKMCKEGRGSGVSNEPWQSACVAIDQLRAALASQSKAEGGQQ